MNKREFLTGAVATALAPTVATAFPLPKNEEGYPQIVVPDFSLSTMRRMVPKDGKWYQVICRKDGMVASTYIKQPSSSVAYLYGAHRSEQT